MADWDLNENAYNADPEKWLANLEVELTQQREAQNLRDATMKNLKWTRPRLGKRNNHERLQRGFYQTFPKATKRPTLNMADLEEEAMATSN